MAWRASDRRGRRLEPLTFAYRGSQHLPDSLRSVIYGPGTHRPEFHGHGPAGWGCFDRHVVCVPRWDYRLRGVPPNAATITVYAWDWAGNVSVRTSRLR